MNDFMQGFIQAAKETPRKYFTPLTAIWFSVKRPGGVFLASACAVPDHVQALKSLVPGISVTGLPFHVGMYNALHNADYGFWLRLMNIIHNLC